MPLIQATYAAAAVIVANTAPVTGNVNKYNASAGALAVTLPALSGLNDGVNFIIGKDPLDLTMNTVTFTRNGTDTFDDGSTSIVFNRPGRNVLMQVVTIAGTKFWSAILASELNQRGGIVSNIAQFALSNSSTATDVIAATLPAGGLFAGSTYRIRLHGTVQTQATSGTLTFTPFLQGVALNTVVMATQTGASGPFGFDLELIVTVRSTGTSGSAIAHGSGRVNFATVVSLTPAVTVSATAVNTTAAASSNIVKVQATWQTASATNTLKVETAFIERVI